MRIAYLDCFSGISGDMFLGALLDAGVPFELFEKTVAELNVGATLERSRVDRGGISATKLDVIVNGEKDMPREEFWARRGAGDGGLGASGQWPVASGQAAGNTLIRMGMVSRTEEPQIPPLRFALVGMTDRSLRSAALQSG